MYENMKELSVCFALVQSNKLITSIFHNSPL